MRCARFPCRLRLRVSAATIICSPSFCATEVLPALPADLMTFLLPHGGARGAVRAAVRRRARAAGLRVALRAAREAEPAACAARPRARHLPVGKRLFGDALRPSSGRSEPELEPRLQLPRQRLVRRAAATPNRRSDRATRWRRATRRARGRLLWTNLTVYLGVRADRARGAVARRVQPRPDRGSRAAALLRRSLRPSRTGRSSRAQHWAVAASAVLARRDRTWNAPPRCPRRLAIIEALLGAGGAAQMRRVAGRALSSSRPTTARWRWWCCACSKAPPSTCLARARRASRRSSGGAELSGMDRSSVALPVPRRGGDGRRRAGGTGSPPGSSPTARTGCSRPPGSTSTRCQRWPTPHRRRSGPHQGSVDDAKRDLRRGIELLAELGDYIPWYVRTGRILLAHASLWLADVVGAPVAAGGASRLARKTPDAVIFKKWFDGAWEYMDTLAESSLSGPSSLTIAELRILRFLPSHRSFREIASSSACRRNTVKTQAHAVYRKPWGGVTFGGRVPGARGGPARAVV